MHFPDKNFAVLAIGAHPDDVEYGCAATLSRFVEKGNEVYIHTLTDGRCGGDIITRKKEAMKAADIIGVKKIFWGNYEDTKLPFQHTIINDMQEIIDEIKPVFVLMHDPDDTHQDHRHVTSCAISASRFVPNVLYYEGPSTVHFNPDVFVNIQNLMEKKFKCLRAHKSQVNRTNIYNQTIIDLARATAIFRGEYCHQKFAEAFKALRMMFLLP